ncbi:TonB-dependent receptor [Sphingomonas sp. RS2018]
MRLRTLFAASTALALALPLAAQAQTASAVAPVPQDGSRPTTGADAQDENVGEIIVTATKRNERLQDVPASVSVVSGADLLEQGAVRFTDYASQVPGLSLTSARQGVTQVVVRGITTGAAQPGSTTAFYIDEAPVGSVNAYTGGNAITPDLDPSDLAQVEVLKGPQGTLYGAGAVGGLLKFTTVNPDLNDLTVRASAGLTGVSGGGKLGYAGRAMINIPLATDQLTFRASGFYRNDPGYVDNVNPRIGRNDVNEATVRGGRAVLSMRFSPDVSLDLSALLQDTSTQGSNAVDVDAATLRPIYGDLKQDRSAVEYGLTKLRLYNATLRATLGGLDIVSSTTFQKILNRDNVDSRRNFVPLYRLVGSLLGPALGFTIPADVGLLSRFVKSTDRWSQELRAGATDIGGVLDLQVGGYWTYEDDKNLLGIDSYSQTTGNAYVLPAFANASILSSYKEWSGFGNARVKLAETFDVLGGIRVAHDEQRYSQNYSGLLILASAGQPALIANGRESATVTTWMVSPRFRPSDNVTLYGRVATGYRPGGPNPAPPTGNIPNTFAPDRLIQYELGFKGQTADRSLSADAALFYTDWDKIQIQTSAGGFNFIVNSPASARSQGAELTLRYNPVRALSMTLNAAYTDATLRGNAPAAGGLSGDRLPYVPRWSGSLVADYAVPLSGDNALTIGATASYVGDRTSDYSNRFPKRLDDYATFDLRAGLTAGNLSVNAFVRNVTDERQIVVASPQATAPSATAGAFYSGAIIQPRTVGAEAAIRF